MATKLLDWVNGTGETIGAVTTDLITYAVPANSNVSFKARVQMFEATPAGGAIEINGSFSRAAGAPAADNVTVSLSSILAATLATAAVAFVISGNNIVVRATGIALKTIEWHAEGKVNVYTP